ncbi:cellulase precursor [Fusarium beomiforme]|uniref:cellulase n=1 Tax=Fusarium beomiforme TaxID=44412 RepID=A0A9P5APG3_9HYPO|nr:cellulase precursor [Fusarium beomiforme]
MKSLFALSLFTGLSVAQNAAWAQCGGNGWSGSTTCVSGYKCTVVNEWYSQCIPGTAAEPTTTLRTTTTGGGSTPTGSPGKFLWVGTNEAGAEFGETNLPGTWGKHFTFPDPAAVDTLISQGYNTFRVQLRMERTNPSSMTGAFDTAYMKNLTSIVDHITGKGANVILDPHNYGRYFNNIITSTSDFQTWWKNFATEFKSNSKIIFDTNNEYNTMDQTLVLNLNQAAINGIRAAGATQTIFVEGNQWSGAWSWPDVNDNMKALTDPLDKIVYEMHQYLDSDSSGTSPNCVSTTIGVERLKAATQWLRTNKKVGMIGEFAGGPNDTCKTAVKGMLDYLLQNSDVWKGVTWWAAGPWWADYMYSFEPPSGTAYQYYNSLLKTYI